MFKIVGSPAGATGRIVYYMRFCIANAVYCGRKNDRVRKPSLACKVRNAHTDARKHEAQASLAVFMFTTKSDLFALRKASLTVTCQLLFRSASVLCSQMERFAV